MEGKHSVHYEPLYPSPCGRLWGFASILLDCCAQKPNLWIFIHEETNIYLFGDELTKESLNNMELYALYV